MSEERIAAGVERIERALSRIKAAAGRPASPDTASDTGEFEALRTRHAALRDEVTAALRELDEVLARG